MGKKRESEASLSTINQGQGPEFISEDPQLRKKNPAREGDGDDVGKSAPLSKEKPDGADPRKEDLPGRQKEGVPYIGDNPQETEEEAPKTEK